MVIVCIEKSTQKNDNDYNKNGLYVNEKKVIIIQWLIKRITKIRSL